MQTIGQTKRRTYCTDIIMALVRQLGLQMLTIAQNDKAERMTPVPSLVKLSKVIKHVALRPQMMSVDVLGANRDQCLSMVQCCFTSTETVSLIRTESPGRPPRL